MLDVYTREHKNLGGENGSGLLLTGKAAVTTVLIVSVETFKYVQDFLSRSRAQTQHQVDNKVHN